MAAAILHYDRGITDIRQRGVLMENKVENTSRQRVVSTAADQLPRVAS